MSSDVEKQLAYLRKRFTKLVAICQKDGTAKTVSGETRNITQDLLTRLNRLLDNIMYEYFQTRIVPTLSPEAIKAFKSKVQFPAVSKKEDLSSVLGMFGLARSDSPKLFALLDKSQPYNGGQEWIGHLRTYSNLGHRKLIPQDKKKDIFLTLGDTVAISDKASVRMNNVVINGVPVDELVVDKGVVTGKISPKLNPKVRTEITYVFEDTSIDVLDFLKEALNGVEEIAKAFEKFL